MAGGVKGRHNLELAHANFVFELQQSLAKWCKEIVMLTELRHNNMTFLGPCPLQKKAW